MTTRNILCNGGSVLFLRRTRLSNQERMDTPMTEVEALAIAHDNRVSIDFRILALHRLMDIAHPLRGEQSDKLWGQIGATMQNDFEVASIPFAVMKHFKERVPFKGMQCWAHHELRSRAFTSAAQKQQRIAA